MDDIMCELLSVGAADTKETEKTLPVLLQLNPPPLTLKQMFNLLQEFVPGVWKQKPDL